MKDIIFEEKKQKKNELNNFQDRVRQWEEGDLSQGETADLFQELLDTGYIRKFRPYYQQIANNLIACGDCHLPITVES